VKRSLKERLVAIKPEHRGRFEVRRSEAFLNRFSLQTDCLGP